MAKVTRAELNEQAASLGIAGAEEFGTNAELQAAIDAATATTATTVVPGEPVKVVATAEAAEPATASGNDPEAIKAYLADPQRNPYPEGLVINFGDPEPFRHVTE